MDFATIGTIFRTADTVEQGLNVVGYVPPFHHFGASARKILAIAETVAGVAAAAFAGIMYLQGNPMSDIALTIGFTLAGHGGLNLLRSQVEAEEGWIPRVACLVYDVGSRVFLGDRVFPYPVI